MPDIISGFLLVWWKRTHTVFHDCSYCFWACSHLSRMRVFREPGQHYAPHCSFWNTNSFPFFHPHDNSFPDPKENEGCLFIHQQSSPPNQHSLDWRVETQHWTSGNELRRNWRPRLFFCLSSRRSEVRTHEFILFLPVNSIKPCSDPRKSVKSICSCSGTSSRCGQIQGEEKELRKSF